ncbi:MAG TPA: hypothetical protein PLG15_02705 [Candidatus Gastranaerophilaceae bacterium]|nr:hypothetical protein [Candidatus Gastranaerophilaceae bacterium]HPT41274.1 hypothetical protein [Candidatus Gastranaerophilaceae bacterium]
MSESIASIVKKDGQIFVNVKPAGAKEGKLGEGGVLVKCKDEEEAKAMVKEIDAAAIKEATLKEGEGKKIDKAA